MKTLFNKHKWMQILFGILLLTAGIIVLVVSLSNPGQISKWLSVILAITCFIFAASLIFSAIFNMNKKRFDSSLLYGALFISIGVILCVNSTIISDYIIIFLGTFLIALGAIGIGQACAFIYFHNKPISIALGFILGALLLTFGILSLNFQSEVSKIIYIVVAAIIILLGILEISIGINAIYKSKKSSRNAQKNRNKKVVTAEIVENTDSEKDIKKIENKSKPKEIIENKQED